MIPRNRITTKSVSAGHFELAIDGHKSTAFLKSVDGGWVRGNIVDDPVGAGALRVKHMSTVDIEPFSFEFGLTAANDVLQWIQGSWKRQWGRRNGQVTHGDFNMNPLFEHEFYDALIAETTFPALDGSSKESGYIKCKVQPERVITKKVVGGPPMTGRIGPKTAQKMWTNAAFRLNIDTIDDMRYTNKIESFTIKQGIKKSYSGAERFPQCEPTGVTFPNLTGTISLEYADKLLQWHHDYIVQGKKDRASQKTGSLEFLTPDRKSTIFQINLFEVGLSFCGLEQATANQETIKRVKFELYVHRMELDGTGSLGFE